MEERLEMLCKVIDRVGRVRGRKRIQKMLFIAKSLEYPIDYEFEWANYGTYSVELQNNLKFLRDQGFIEESRERVGDYMEYQYRPTEICVRHVGDGSPEISENFEELLRFLDEQDVEQLELWSSILYLIDQGESGEELVTFLNYLKPRFDIDMIREEMGRVMEIRERYRERCSDE